MLPGIAIGGMIGAPIIGGLIGNAAAAGDRAKAAGLMHEAMAALMAAGMPPDQSKAVVLREAEQSGLLTAELEEAIDIGYSKLAEAQISPEGRDAQLNALRMLQQRAKTGLSAEDRAAFNELRQQVQADQEAKRQQLVQGLQARGQAGGGAELAAQLMAQQQGAQQEAAAGDRLAAEASRNALQAAISSGQMGGQLRSADWGEETTRLSAADEMNKFDKQYQIGRTQRNTEARRRAQEANIARQQQVADYNVAQANREKYNQLDRQRQYWQDQMDRGRALAGQFEKQSNYYQRQGDQTAGMYAGIGDQVGKGFGMAGGMSDDRLFKLMDKKQG